MLSLGSRHPAWSSGSVPIAGISSPPPPSRPRPRCSAPIALLRAPGRCCTTMAEPPHPDCSRTRVAGRSLPATAGSAPGDHERAGACRCIARQCRASARRLLDDACDDDTDRGVGHEPERLASPQGDADAVGGVERLELLSQIRRQRAADRAGQPYDVLASKAEERPWSDPEDAPELTAELLDKPRSEFLRLRLHVCRDSGLRRRGVNRPPELQPPSRPQP